MPSTDLDIQSPEVCDEGRQDPRNGRAGARRHAAATRFIQRMVGLGLTAPMASMLLMHYGIAQAQPVPAYKPTKRGGGGALKVLWWQGADAAAAALRHRHQGPGRLAHLLRAARPSGTPTATWCRSWPPRCPSARQRRPGSPTARSVTWKLKRGVTWHDGQPFTADDVRVHLGVRAATRRTAAVTIGVYKDVKVDEGRRRTPSASRSTSRRRSGPPPSSRPRA